MPNTDRKSPKPLSPEWEAQNKHRKLADALDASYEPIFPEEEYEAEEVVEEGAPRGRAIAQKATLNLCMKEKQLISPAVFVPVLLVILVLAALIGYFGVYMPFDSVRKAQAELDAKKAEYNQKFQEVVDSNSVKEEYNKYYCDEYDVTLIDRLEVFDLLERVVFPECTVRRITIRNNLISLDLANIPLAKVSDLITKLRKEELVSEVAVSTTSYNDGVQTASMTILLVDDNSRNTSNKEGN